MRTGFGGCIVACFLTGLSVDTLRLLLINTHHSDHLRPLQYRLQGSCLALCCQLGSTVEAEGLGQRSVKENVRTGLRFAVSVRLLHRGAAQRPEPMPQRTRRFQSHPERGRRPRAPACKITSTDVSVTAQRMITLRKGAASLGCCQFGLSEADFLNMANKAVNPNPHEAPTQLPS